MLEDWYLIWRLQQGHGAALRRIYGKYRDDLLRLAVSLSNETTTAEDVVHAPSDESTRRRPARTL